VEVNIDGDARIESIQFDRREGVTGATRDLDLASCSGSNREWCTVKVQLAEGSNTYQIKLTGFSAASQGPKTWDVQPPVPCFPPRCQIEFRFRQNQVQVTR
jgi:hypothetical protein